MLRCSRIYRTWCTILGPVRKRYYLRNNPWCQQIHIIRATLESIAYQVNDVLTAMKADSGIELSSLKVDGGASANNLLMQMQADISGAPVNRPVCVETTAMGAAYLAGLSVGYWKSTDDIRKNWSVDRTFDPEITQNERDSKVRMWKKAVSYSFNWDK